MPDQPGSTFDAEFDLRARPENRRSSGAPLDLAGRVELCQQRIGYRFKQPALLVEALTHASGAAHRLASNERLEFLGDAILGLVVCEWLYHEFPHYSEGDLTRIKSVVVSRRTCARIARSLELEECLVVGKGVSRNLSFPKSLSSDVFEAIVAAIFLDGGIDPVRELLHEWLSDELHEVATGQRGGNYKSLLQQLTQRDQGRTPEYKLVTERGPDHSKSFKVVAIVGESVFPPAWGRNKKDAERRAAGNALAALQGQPIPYTDDLA